MSVNWPLRVALTAVCVWVVDLAVTGQAVATAELRGTAQASVFGLSAANALLWAVVIVWLVKLVRRRTT